MENKEEIIKTSKGNIQKDNLNCSQSLTNQTITQQQVTDDELRKVEEKADIEFEKALKKISEDKSSNIIEELYEIPKHYAKMVAKGLRKGLILYGNAGLGKSYNTQKAFTEVGVPFIYMSGHITNLALYHFLYQHRTEHIILDDVNILDNEINLNMLKSALNDITPKVCYSTSSGKLKVPNQFLFEGSLTILLNKKPRNNESLKAVESRILVYELKLDYKQKLMLMKQISLMPYEKLTQEQRNEVFDWIIKNTNESTENFNLRDLIKMYDFYRYNQTKWKNLAKTIFHNNYEMELIIQGVHHTKWCKMTGKSRKSYYNYKARIK